MENIPRVGTGSTIQRSKKVTQVSVFNMSTFLFQRQHDFLTKTQQLHDAAMDVTNARLLPASLMAFRHAYVITKHALLKKDRDYIDEQLRKIRKKMDEWLYKPNMPKEKYYEIHDDVFELINLLYEAQQNVRLGIPKETYKDAETLLHEATSR